MTVLDSVSFAESLRSGSDIKEYAEAKRAAVSDALWCEPWQNYRTLNLKEDSQTVNRRAKRHRIGRRHRQASHLIFGGRNESMLIRFGSYSRQSNELPDAAGRRSI